MAPGPFRNMWRDAIRKELDTHLSNGTWKTKSVQLPPGRTAVANLWVFTIKADTDGMVIKFKARLVAKRYSQRHGLDYDEVFAPVAHMTSLRTVLALAAQQNLILEQIDIVAAYLNGVLDETVFMEVPAVPDDMKDELAALGHDHCTNGGVLQLVKGLYGLKQAGKVWNRKIDDVLTRFLGFTKLHADPCVYIKRNGENFIIAVLYVDDMLFAHNWLEGMDHVRAGLSSVFALTLLGEPR